MDLVDDSIIDSRRFIGFNPFQHVIEPGAAGPGILAVVVTAEDLDLILFRNLSQQPVPTFTGNQI